MSGSDPRRDYAERLWEHLQTAATPAERAALERALQKEWEQSRPWWRRLPGLRGKLPRLPPMELAGASMPVPKVRHAHGYPIEGFFAAGAHEIDCDVVEYGPGSGFAGVEAKSVTPVEAATLGVILGAGSYEVLVEEMTGTEQENENGENGLFQVCPEIRDCIAAMDDISAVAKRWAETEELVRSRWTEQDAYELLVALRDLAGQARNEDKQLWIWWSL